MPVTEQQDIIDTIKQCLNEFIKAYNDRIGNSLKSTTIKIKLRNSTYNISCFDFTNKL